MAKSWYVIHTRTGFEERVLKMLQAKIEDKELTGRIAQVLIPTEDVMQVTPESAALGGDPTRKQVMIGIEFSMPEIIHIPPTKQLTKHASLIFRVLTGLLSPGEAANASKGVGSMVEIAKTYKIMLAGGFAGLMLALWFTCMLNVNLAILNLLPIPVLDGGLILFSLWEMITRKPPNAKVVGILTNTFAVLLIILILLLVARDIKWNVFVDPWGRPAGSTNTVKSVTNAVVRPGTSTNDTLNTQASP